VVKRLIFIFSVLLMVSLAACIQIILPASENATATVTSAPTAVDTSTAPPPTPTTPPPAPTPTPTAAATQTALPTAAAKLITAQNASSLKVAHQFTLGEPASQYLWNKDGSLIIVTQQGFSNIDLPTLQPGKFTSIGFVGHFLSVSPDGASVVSMQQDGSLQVWDLASTQVKQTIHPSETPMRAVFSPDGKTLAVTSADSISVTLWDIASGKQTATLQGFETAAPVYQVQFSPDGRSLVWIARASVQFMDIASEKMGARMEFEDFVNSLVFAPDGKTVAIAVADFVSLRQVSDGSETQHLTLDNPALDLAYSPDGQLLAIAADNEIILAGTSNGQTIAKLTGSTAMVRSVGFSPDGSTLVGGTDDGSISFYQPLP
jgi:WD40 repeat protein